MTNKNNPQTIYYRVSRWPIEQITGYKPKTTFWEDFSIADFYGLVAIQDTYNRAFNEWKGNYIYLTELVMVLNWKIWQWYEDEKDRGKSDLYNSLWRKADAYACTHLKGDELTYFYQVTD